MEVCHNLRACVIILTPRVGLCCDISHASAAISMEEALRNLARNHITCGRKGNGTLLRPSAFGACTTGMMSHSSGYQKEMSGNTSRLPTRLDRLA